MLPPAIKYTLAGHGLQTHDLNSLACKSKSPDLSWHFMEVKKLLPHW